MEQLSLVAHTPLTAAALDFMAQPHSFLLAGNFVSVLVWPARTQATAPCVPHNNF